jgi:hypothetical protein
MFGDISGVRQCSGHAAPVSAAQQECGVSQHDHQRDHWRDLSCALDTALRAPGQALPGVAPRRPCSAQQEYGVSQYVPSHVPFPARSCVACRVCTSPRRAPPALAARRR